MDHGPGQRVIRVEFPMRTPRTGAEVWDELDYNPWVGIWPCVQLPVQPFARDNFKTWLVPVITRIKFVMHFDAPSWIWGPLVDIVACGGGTYEQQFSIQPASQVTEHPRKAVWLWSNHSHWQLQNIAVDGPPEVINPPVQDYYEDTRIKIYERMNIWQAFALGHTLPESHEGFCMPNGKVYFDFDIEWEEMSWLQFQREKHRDQIY